MEKNIRIKRGNLLKISSAAGIPNSRLSEYASTRIRPRPNRARMLESACLEAGYDVPAHVWLLGTSNEIKGRLNL